MGYATSAMMKMAIVDFFNEKNITDWNVDSIALNMSRDYVNDADIIVTSLDLRQDEYKVPVISGIALISGIGKDAVLQEILENIRRIESDKS
jgi:galactitol-specific phosphotransferase system IIB component